MEKEENKKQTNKFVSWVKKNKGKIFLLGISLLAFLSVFNKYNKYKNNNTHNSEVNNEDYIGYDYSDGFNSENTSENQEVLVTPSIKTNSPTPSSTIFVPLETDETLTSNELGNNDNNADVSLPNIIVVPDNDASFEEESNDLDDEINVDELTPKPITLTPITPTPGVITQEPKKAEETPEVGSSTPELITPTPDLATLTPILTTPTPTMKTPTPTENTPSVVETPRPTESVPSIPEMTPTPSATTPPVLITPTPYITPSPVVTPPPAVETLPPTVTQNPEPERNDYENDELEQPGIGSFDKIQFGEESENTVQDEINALYEMKNVIETYNLTEESNTLKLSY